MMKRIKEYYNKYRLRSNMIAINILIGILPIIVIGIIAYQINYYNMKKSVLSSVDILFNQVSGRLEEYFNNMDLISKSVFFSKNLQLNILDNDEEYSFLKYNYIRDYLDSYLELNNSLNGICIYDIKTDKYYMSTVPVDNGSLLYLKNLDYDTIKTGAIHIIATFNSDEAVLNDLLVIRGIKSITQDNYFKPFGVGAIIVDRKKLEGMMLGSQISIDFEVYIVDKQSRIIASTQNKTTEQGLKEYLQSNKNNMSEYTRIDSKDYLLKSKDIKNTDWRIVAVVPKDKLLKEIEVIRHLIIVIIAIIFLIVIFINLFFNVLITKPLKQLTDAFDRVASGDFKYKIKVKNKDEITAIADKFNNMVDEIKSLTGKILNTQQQLYETELKKKQFELNGLQTQINSHFLYNTLNSIVGMALAGAKREIVFMVDNLSTFLRYGTKNNEYVTLEEELRHLDRYLNIQKTRFGNKFKVKFEISEEIMTCKILKLTIQPLVENAIFHGLEQKPGQGVICISGFEKDNEVIIKVMDNGVGIEPGVLDKLNKAFEDDEPENGTGEARRGIGIVNINKRVRLYYGSGYGLTVKSRSSLGTAVILKIPVLKEGV